MTGSGQLINPLMALALLCVTVDTAAAKEFQPPSADTMPCRVAGELIDLYRLETKYTPLSAELDDPNWNGRHIVSLANSARDTLTISRNVGTEEVTVALGAPDSASVTMSGPLFTDVFCRCVGFTGFEAQDEVVIDHLDTGFVSRSLGVPYANLAGATVLNDKQERAIHSIEVLTDHGALGIAMTNAESTRDDAGMAPWREAIQNTVALTINADAYANVRNGARIRADSRHKISVGGGTFVRLGDRLFVVTAGHVVPRQRRRSSLIATTVDGREYSVSLLLHGREQIDLAALSFTDREAEREALARYGGMEKIEPGSDGAFVFHLGFPSSWSTEPTTANASRDDARGNARNTPPMVLTSGIITEVGATMTESSIRLQHGNSGGGLFQVTASGHAALIGPASTARSAHGEGNLPGQRALGPVHGRFVTLTKRLLAMNLPL